MSKPKLSFKDLSDIIDERGKTLLQEIGNKPELQESAERFVEAGQNLLRGLFNKSPDYIVLDALDRTFTLHKDAIFNRNSDLIGQLEFIEHLLSRVREKVAKISEVESLQTTATSSYAIASNNPSTGGYQANPEETSKSRRAGYFTPINEPISEEEVEEELQAKAPQPLSIRQRWRESIIKANKSMGTR